MRFHVELGIHMKKDNIYARHVHEMPYLHDTLICFKA